MMNGLTAERESTMMRRHVVAFKVRHMISILRKFCGRPSFEYLTLSHSLFRAGFVLVPYYYYISHTPPAPLKKEVF